MKQKPKDVSAEVVKTTIRLRREIWNAVLHHCIDANLTQQEIVEQALEQYLRNR
jgi:predicted XRE-type DNA-binding protein